VFSDLCSKEYYYVWDGYRYSIKKISVDKLVWDCVNRVIWFYVCVHGAHMCMHVCVYAPKLQDILEPCLVSVLSMCIGHWEDLEAVLAKLIWPQSFQEIQFGKQYRWMDLFSLWKFFCHIQLLYHNFFYKLLLIVYITLPMFWIKTKNL
jgi:hypothetical protein